MPLKILLRLLIFSIFKGGWDRLSHGDVDRAEEEEPIIHYVDVFLLFR